jgi:hypothetical protein
MYGMVVKWTLAALIALGFSLVAIAAIDVVRHGQGSPASWLLGLCLVVVLARLGEDGAGLDVF